MKTAAKIIGAMAGLLVLREVAVAAYCYHSNRVGQ